ncbi:MAG: flippase-like domain-containing protein, partial [Chloroflexia bacterium]|nr:flippase-like domain-containing protein [Chloroflexia bacterium]
SGLGVLRRRRDLAFVAGMSVLAWLFEASMYWELARGFGGAVERAMGVAATLLTTGVAMLATLIPSSPGYIGQFEYGVKLVLSGALGVAEGPALAYAILVHVALYVPITLLGVFEWSRLHLSLGDVRQPDDFEEDRRERTEDRGQGTVDGLFVAGGRGSDLDTEPRP